MIPLPPTAEWETFLSEMVADQLFIWLFKKICG
uniref:Uncharacterized protein n=1 Tax=Candidatus Kentrum sp. TC TaxID=2126339 RepID=A0A451AF69_9GAMM|nr:MAG: hypothetical protein BECKTC1821F_GA0114240_11401 [Candidatus Kentron sp. TC]